MLKQAIIVLLIAATAVLGNAAVVEQPFVKTVSSVVPYADPVNLEKHVKYLSVDLYPRSFDQFENTARTVEYIEQEFRNAGARVSTQDVVVQETTYQNVIGRFGPEDGPVLVIGAHYDSYGDAIGGARDPRGYSLESHTPGADDNASGVAGLLELARLLGASNPKGPVELVAYANEEPPHFRTEHMGSNWHAQLLSREGRIVRLMVSLEMIGYFSDVPGSQSYPLSALSLLYGDRGNFVALVGRMGDFAEIRRAKALMAGASDLPVFSINSPSLLPGIDYSDHRSYWKQGYPAVMVTDTAFFRNSNYHAAEDTYEKLDYVRMAKVVQGIYALAQDY